MRKVALGVGLALLLAACADSTSDVDTATREEPTALPDTVIVQDGVRLEIYGPLNSYGRDRSAELMRMVGVQRGFERLADRGLLAEYDGAIHVKATDANGRSLETTWFPFVDPSDEAALAVVVHVVQDGQELVIPYGSRGGEPDIESISIDGKNAPGPSGIPNLTGGCFGFATELFQSCVGLCILNGLSSRTCSVSCRAASAAALTACVLMSAE
ncbi:MAG: hypothetical protein L0Z51_12730 [Candidatus Latescibacteria bacterium]|nr:hypothetical protein [Candidatus Latescibacterota bacterium]